MNEEKHIIKRLVSAFENMNKETLGTTLVVDSIKKSLTNFGWRYKSDIPNVKGIKINCLLENGLIEEKEVKKGEERNSTYYIDGYNEVVMWKNKT